MDAILRQAKANLRGSKLQATLISLTLFAAATLLTVALNTLHIAQGAFDRLFERTNAPHLWLSLDPVALSRDDLERILGTLPGLETVGRAYRTISTTLFLGEVWENGPKLRDWPDDDGPVGRPLLIEGRSPYPGERDVIVLDHHAALQYDIQVGDRVGVLTPNGRQDLKVIGLFLSTEVCPTCFPFVNYVAPGTLTELGLLPAGEADLGALDVGLRLTNPSQTQVILQFAEKALPAGAILGWDEWQDLRRYADSSIQLQRILLLTFTAVAILAAGFLVANTIVEAVRNQTRQIGLLKAVGFTSGQVAAIYLVESLCLALITSIAGLIAGSLIAMFTLRSVAMLFGDTLFQPAPWIVIATPLVTSFVVGLFTLLAVRRAVRLDAVEAIRNGEERPRHQRSWLGVGVLRHLPLPFAVGIREVLTQPVRATLTTIGLITAIVTMVSALTLKATLQVFLSDPAQFGFDGDLFIRRSSYISEEKVRQLIAAQPEITSYYGEQWHSFQFPGENAYYYARFREGDLETFHFPIVEGRLYQKHGEAVVGYGLVYERGIQLGDTMDIQLDNQPFSLKVVGMYRENSNNGRMLLLPSETLRLVLLESGTTPLETSTFVAKLNPAADPYAVAEALTEASNDFLGVRVTGSDELPASIASLPAIMTVLTLVLGAIASLGVFNSFWMGVQERRRGFGVLKSVGMTPEQVMLTVLAGVSGTAITAYALGLPLGLVGIRLLMSWVATSIGFGPLNPWNDNLGLALLLPEVILLALGGAFIPAYRAGRTSVVEVLRHE